MKNFYTPQTKREATTLFHKLWGQAKESPEYNKNEWIEFQSYLEEAHGKRTLRNMEERKRPDL